MGGKARLAAAWAVTVVALLTVGGFAPPVAATTHPGASINAELAWLINHERASYGLPALPVMDLGAQAWAHHLVVTGTMAHGAVYGRRREHRLRLIEPPHGRCGRHVDEQSGACDQHVESQRRRHRCGDQLWRGADGCRGPVPLRVVHPHGVGGPTRCSSRVGCVVRRPRPRVTSPRRP